MTIYADLDYETPPASRAFGTFTVIGLKEDDPIDGLDVTHRVVIGSFYQSLEALRRELDLSYGMPIPPIAVEEV
ncbi:hypothetical protein CJD36_016865 [Flavipsychrobacter stenotrophus]|uniref:Uncharacterized protein n=1 Tax=Flavipsychrobacter stenotrophus TaxID=2077091 RepID=A0A2S7SSK0_9BACT|nr:hypothetical protein [Flavipsychrobacter stenotrophus]PQJ09611.1 hypothetical protein CJD36_016865 [Flavipsychrobacter stenotrophus]